jgi:hypothetical protein
MWNPDIRINSYLDFAVLGEGEIEKHTLRTADFASFRKNKRRVLITARCAFPFLGVDSQEGVKQCLCFMSGLLSGVLL